MNQHKLTITYSVFSNISELPAADADLLNDAKNATVQAYAPYSNFLLALLHGCPMVK